MTRRAAVTVMATFAATVGATVQPALAIPATISAARLGSTCASISQPGPPLVVTLDAPVPRSSRIVVPVLRWGSLDATVVDDSRGNAYALDYAQGLGYAQGYFEVWSAPVRQALEPGDTIKVGTATAPVGTTWKFCPTVLRVDGLAAFEALDQNAHGSGAVLFGFAPFNAGPTAPTREAGEWFLALMETNGYLGGDINPTQPLTRLSAEHALGQLPVVIFQTASMVTGGAGPQTLSGNVVSDGQHNGPVYWDAALLTYRPRHTVKGDFDGDGSADLVLQDALGALQIWLLAGASRLGPALFVTPAPDPNWRVEAVDDFDGDGRADLVLRDTGGARAVEFWLMDGPVRVAAVPLATPVPAEYTLVGSGDFSGDGRADLLWIDTEAGRLVVWVMGADGAPRTQASLELPIDLPLPPAPWTLAAVADFTNDGQVDLAWHNGVSGRVVVWRMAAKARRVGGGYVTPDGPAKSDWHLVAGADLGLGSQAGVALSGDLLWHNAATGELSVWYMNPSGPPYARTSVGVTEPALLAAGVTVVGPR